MKESLGPLRLGPPKRRALRNFAQGGGDALPHGRYHLIISFECPRRTRRKDRPDVGGQRFETHVARFYAMVLFWLDAGHYMEPPGREALEAFVELVDELMAREDELFASSVSWSAAELRTGVAAAQVLVEAYGCPHRQGDRAHDWFREQELVELLQQLDEHAACCSMVEVNVHWW